MENTPKPSNVTPRDASRVNKAISQGNANHLRDQLVSSSSKLHKSYSEYLSNVKTGVARLEQAINNIKEVNLRLEDVDKTFAEVPKLLDKLNGIREESFRYSQLCTARDNFKHIFDVPANVATTRQYIREGKLLMAHHHLSELENSRSALLYEIHRHPKSSSSDRTTLKHYFSEVDKLSEELEKQILNIMSRALNTVRQDPHTLVSALRIIEREEKTDAFSIKRQAATGFMPQGRPKLLRKKMFENIEENVGERLSGNQFEDRTNNKLWLARHLEIIRLLILEDLRVVKKGFVQCFPPSYNIAHLMLKLYHRCLRTHLQELAAHLEGNEYVTLLNWVKAYPGPELLGHPDLDIDLAKENIEPLLSDETLNELTNAYFVTIEKNYTEWMGNTINSDTRDWASSGPPETDDSGHYQTTTPVFIFQMIDQHLQVAKSFDQTLVNRVLALSMNQLAIFAKKYREAIEKYANNHFTDRQQYKYFTPYMVAITNNCSAFAEIQRKFRQDFKRVGSQTSKSTSERSVIDEFDRAKPKRLSYLQSSKDEGSTISGTDDEDDNADEAFDKALRSFEALRDDSIDYLLQELFLDVDKEIATIGTREWLEGKVSCVENICLTLEDYFQDYRHLKENLRKQFVFKLQNQLAKGYIRAILQRKITLRDYSQRKDFCKRFLNEGEVLKAAVSKLDDVGLTGESPFDALKSLAGCLELKDSSLLSLEVSGLIKRYPDINTDHLTALLSMREDMAKTNVRRQAQDMLDIYQNAKQDQRAVSIFSDITL